MRVLPLLIMAPLLMGAVVTSNEANVETTDPGGGITLTSMYSLGEDDVATYDCGSASCLPLPNGNSGDDADYTVEAYVKGDDGVGWRELFSTFDSAAPGTGNALIWYFEANTDGQAGVFDGSTTTFDAVPADEMDDGQWHRYSFTHTDAANDICFYIDGTLVNCVVKPNSRTKQELFVIGGEEAGFDQPAQAKIVDVRIWTEARSAVDIAAQSDCLVTDAQAGAAGYANWRFTETSGTDVSDSWGDGRTATMADATDRDETVVLSECP